MDAVASLGQRLDRAVKDRFGQRTDRLGRLGGMLRALGPESAFQRGFSITLGPDGRIVTTAASLKGGDLMRTKFGDGETLSVVTEANFSST